MIAVLIIVPLLWIVYSAIEGIKEGYLYNYRNTGDPSYGTNLHPLFTAQRTTVAAIALILFVVISKWYFSPIPMVAFMLVFPLVHDGFYYMTRHKIDKNVYPMGFLTDKSTSTAKISLSRIQRIYAALAGCVVYGIYTTILTW